MKTVIASLLLGVVLALIPVLLVSYLRTRRKWYAEGVSADPEFSQKAERIYRDVKSRHPELESMEIDFYVSKTVGLSPGSNENDAYGRHMTLAGRLHRIDIAQVPHDSDVKLYDTITHELAHALDTKRRGTSGHDAQFRDVHTEIKEHAPMTKVM